MKALEIRQLETRELQEQLETKREELFKLRLSWSTGSLDNPNQMRVIRKDIARLLTVLHERNLAAQVVKGESE